MYPLRRNLVAASCQFLGAARFAGLLWLLDVAPHPGARGQGCPGAWAKMGHQARVVPTRMPWANPWSRQLVRSLPAPAPRCSHTTLSPDISGSESRDPAALRCKLLSSGRSWSGKGCLWSLGSQSQHLRLFLSRAWMLWRTVACHLPFSARSQSEASGLWAPEGRSCACGSQKLPGVTPQVAAKKGGPNTLTAPWGYQSRTRLAAIF